MKMEMMRDSKKTLTILIIEDDEAMRSLLQDFLIEEGFEVISVSNGSEAFRKLAKEFFDIVITDVRMPGLTGLDILPGIRKLQPASTILVITAFGSEEIEGKVLERGADAYLEKPVQLHQLKSLIHQLIDSKGRHDKGGSPFIGQGEREGDKAEGN